MNSNKPLSLTQKIGYGVPEIGIVSVEVIIQVYLLKFYTSVVGLKSELTGIALGIAVLVDAITDPIMGTISDQTGKKRLFILLGSFAVFMTFPLLLNPPEMDSDLAKFFFLLTSYSLVNMSTTVLGVPHAALGAELTRSPTERNTLYGFRLGCGNLGFLLGTFFPGIFLLILKDTLGYEAGEASGPSPAQGSEFSYTGYLVGFLTCLMGIFSFRATRPKNQQPKTPAPSEKKALNIKKILANLMLSLSQLRSNRLFIALLLAFFVATVGRTINASVAIYYYENYLGFSRDKIIFNILGVFIVFITLSIPVWVWLARRFGKKQPAVVGIFLLGVMTCFAYPNFPPENVIWPVLAGVFGGFFVGSILLLDSLVADMADHDPQQERGEKKSSSREGLYFGFWKLITKMARAFGLILTGLLLGLIGFEEGHEKQSSGVGFSLSIIFGPVVGLFFIAGSFILHKIPWKQGGVRGISK